MSLRAFITPGSRHFGELPRGSPSFGRDWCRARFSTRNGKNQDVLINLLESDLLGFIDGFHQPDILLKGSLP